MSKKPITAGKLLSKYIRDLADEPVVPIEEDGSVRMATRAEALARKMWEIAQGYDEVLDDGKVRKHAPNATMITAILDRMEGKVPMTDTKDKKQKASVAERVGDQSKRRLNKLVKEIGDSPE